MYGIVLGEPTANVEFAQDVKNIGAVYNELLRQSMAKRKLKHPENRDAEYDDVIHWLETTDFYEAPASTRFHGSEPFGLVSHHIDVYNEMTQLIKIKKFSGVDIENAALACLVHDWCKINLYESYDRNVKDDNTGKWTKQKAYKTGSYDQPFGHGASSMYIAMKFFDLTDEEALAIRWHQGRWNVCKLEESELSYSNRKFPMVHLVQFSDQLAVTEY